MKYTVNLYRTDNSGFLVARACMKSALQLGGNNNRDTRLLSPEMPQWNNSPWYAPVPADEYAYTNVRASAIRRVMPDLKNPEVMKSITENELDLHVMRSILSTAENTCGGLFLQYLMSFPRWVNARDEIEVGGADYFDILEEAADAERKATDSGLPTWQADTKHIATISDLTHKRYEASTNVAPDKLHEAFARQERQKRCGIDDVSALFLDFVNVIGRKTGCNAAAETVINAIRNLIALLGSCGITDFLTLETACNSAEDALSAFCRALATKLDTESSGPVKAVLFGEQAKQLAAAGNPKQPGPKSEKTKRAPGMTDKAVASMFNKKAQPLVRKVIRNSGDENGEFTSAVKRSKYRSEKGGMNREYGGYCIYEPMRGGNKSGYATYGTLSVDGFRKWLKRYPDPNNRNPYCGFHADMLANPAALAECANIWGRHCKEYARQFYEWRKIHRTAPRSQFRFNASQTVHGAEKMAATQ